jgi:hypothetical protein
MQNMAAVHGKNKRESLRADVLRLLEIRIRDRGT